jgi:hypothetical protein
MEASLETEMTPAVERLVRLMVLLPEHTHPLWASLISDCGDNGEVMSMRWFVGDAAKMWPEAGPRNLAEAVLTTFGAAGDATLRLLSDAAEELADGTGGYAEVWGLPGIRHRTEDSVAVLYRPGLPGRIEIPLDHADLWEKAVLIAKASFEDAIFFWDECPEDWHPSEKGFADSWPERYGIGNVHYHDSRLASDVLRRLPAICKPFAAHDMWFNFRGGDGYEIEFEWQNSGPPREILDLLLHDKDGLPVQIDTFNGERSTDHFYTDDCAFVSLQSQSGSRFDLRHLRYQRDRGDEARPTQRDPARRRLELERMYGYPSSEKFLQHCQSSKCSL